MGICLILSTSFYCLSIVSDRQRRSFGRVEADIAVMWWCVHAVPRKSLNLLGCQKKPEMSVSMLTKLCADWVFLRVG